MVKLVVDESPCPTIAFTHTHTQTHTHTLQGNNIPNKTKRTTKYKNERTKHIHTPTNTDSHTQAHRYKWYAFHSIGTICTPQGLLVQYYNDERLSVFQCKNLSFVFYCWDVCVCQPNELVRVHRLYNEIVPTFDLRTSVGPQYVALTQYVTINPVCHTSSPEMSSLTRNVTITLPECHRQHVTSF